MCGVRSSFRAIKATRLVAIDHRHFSSTCAALDWLSTGGVLWPLLRGSWCWHQLAMAVALLAAGAFDTPYAKHCIGSNQLRRQPCTHQMRSSPYHVSAWGIVQPSSLMQRHGTAGARQIAGLACRLCGTVEGQSCHIDPSMGCGAYAWGVGTSFRGDSSFVKYGSWQFH